jgi:hypothetical protein
MTCKEFHSHFGISTGGQVLTGSDDFADHMSACADCCRLFELQQEADRQLRLIRDSVPQVSASLDARILASYRDFVAGRTTASASVSLRERISPLVLSWRGAIAAGVLAAAILALTFRRDVNTIAPFRAIEPASVLQAPNPRVTAAAIAEKTKPHARNALARQLTRKRSAGSLARADSSLPAGFRSLMYCDQLSCAEAMEIIRVQLPTSIAGLTPGSTPTDGMVFADVLVGPDGIARGIRIVE